MRRIRLLFIFSILFILTACGGGKDSNTIRANGIVDGDFLEINVKVTNYATGGDHATFFSEKELPALKDVIDNTSITGATLKTEIVNDYFLMIEKTTEKHKTYYYMIVNVGKSDDKQSNYYYFTAPKSPLNDEHYVYIPHHLLQFKQNINIHFNIVKDNKYEINGTEEDIFNFYNNIDMYNVERENDKMIVNINNDANFTGIHTENSFILHFADDDGKRVVEFEVITDDN